MAAGDEERPDPPDYNVYRAGSGSGGRGPGKGKEPRAKRDRAAKRSGDGDPEGDRPAYSVYRSRRGRLGRGLGGGGEGGGDVEALRERLRRQRRRFRRREASAASEPGAKPLWRRVLRWALIAAGAWILLSVILFMVSAQIQKGKLNGGAADELGGFPLLVASGETILVIGTDARPAGSNEAGAETQTKCLDAAADGDPPPSTCQPTRADTLMLVRAGGGAFEKLSIPRDTFAAIGGQSAQKINAAYAFGGAKLEIQTVEDFLGINVDHAVILDFEGFADFIDSIGGVEVNLRNRVKSLISGGSSNGGITLKLDRGVSTLDGQQALALARTRENLRDPTEDDTDRAARQQLILAGIKSRLTSITRLPYNFLHGPWIAWNAPRAMVSDMGAFTLPQLVLAAAIGGNSGAKVLKPSGVGPGGSLLISSSECEKAVKAFLGDRGPHPPACSPSG